MGARTLAAKAVLLVPGVALWTWLCLIIGDALRMIGGAAHHAGDAGTGCGGFASGPGAVAGVLSMWLVMLAAMIVPVVAPWAVAVVRQGRRAGVLCFLSGYAAVWLLCAGGTTALQALLSTVLTPELILGDGTVRAAMFLLAGAFQWSRLKQSCLRHCESPITFVLSHWRDGAWGAAVMGAQHGLYCVGCCWALMLFMVAVGAMGVAWMTAFTLFTLAEMYVAELRWLSRASGALLVAAGFLSLAL